MLNFMIRIILIHFHSFLACENYANSQKFIGNITHLFDAFNSSWCIGALNLNKMVLIPKMIQFEQKMKFSILFFQMNINPPANCSNNDINERKKRQLYRRFGGADNSYSITYSDANLIMGSIFVSIFLLFVLVWICKAIAQFLDPPDDFDISL